MAGDSSGSRIFTLIAAIAASATAAGVVVASCLERDFAQRTEAYDRAEARRVARGADAYGVVEMARTSPPASPPMSTVAPAFGATSTTAAELAFGGGSEGTAEPNEANAGTASGANATGAAGAQSTAANPDDANGAPANTAPLGRSLASVLDEAKAETTRTTPVAGHAAHADNDPYNRSPATTATDLDDGLASMSPPAASAPANTQEQDRPRDTRTREEREAEETARTDRARVAAAGSPVRRPRFEGVGAGAFLTEPPIWGASAMTSDPNAGAGPFNTESDYSAGIVFYGTAAAAPVPAGPVQPITAFPVVPLAPPVVAPR